MAVVALGDKVSGREVEKGADENGEYEPDGRCGNGGGAEKRRRRINEEPAGCLSPAPAILQHKIDGIDAVGEVVGQHGDGDDDTDDRRNLEAHTDCHAVKETVRRERERAQIAKGAPWHWYCYRCVIFRVRVEEDDSVQDEIAEESERDEERDG